MTAQEEDLPIITRGYKVVTEVGCDGARHGCPLDLPTDMCDEIAKYMEKIEQCGL